MLGLSKQLLMQTRITPLRTRASGMLCKDEKTVSGWERVGKLCMRGEPRTEMVGDHIWLLIIAIAVWATIFKSH